MSRRTFTAARVATVSLALVLLASCARLPVSRTYLGTERFGSTTIAPAGWTVLDANEVRVNAEGTGPLFLQGFGPAGVDPRAPMNGSLPGGVMTVTLHPGLDAARTAAANSFIADLGAAVRTGKAQILEQSDAVVIDGAWEQRRWIVEAILAPGTVTRVVQTVRTSVEPVGTDRDGAALHAVKALVVGCDPDCFAENRDIFAQMERDWRVR